MRSVTPQHGDLAWFENCVEGGEPYRVTVVYRHKIGWCNVAGVGGPLDTDYLADKPLHLFWRDNRPFNPLVALVAP